LIGSLEGSYFLKTGKLVDFSPQEFVECDTRDNTENRGTDLGCGGGLMDRAFRWAIDNNGLCEWVDYPYVSGNPKNTGDCSEASRNCKKADHSPVSYTDVVTNDESALLSALNQQPVSVAIEADQPSFQFYQSGVFTESCGTTLDHGVLG
jgi:hypothetical protein